MLPKTMKNFFITGTGTHVGKTLISAILMLALNGRYWKPIQTGSSDLDQVKQLTKLSDDFFSIDLFAQSQFVP